MIHKPSCSIFRSSSLLKKTRIVHGLEEEHEKETMPRAAVAESDQGCPTELRVLTEAWAVQYVSHQPYVAIGHLRWDSCN